MSDPLLERIPPQSLEAEQSVLGALLISSGVLEKVTEILKPESFYRHAHGTIYQTILELAERGEPIDLVTVTTLLRTKGVLEEIGGYGYVMDLAASIPTAANAEYYARLVEEKAVLRALITGGTKIVELAYGPTIDLDATIDEAERIIFEVAQSRRQSKDVAHIKDVLQKTFETIEHRYEHRDNVMGYKTEFIDLDFLTSGLNPSDLIILAARPAMGKCLTARTLIDDPASGERKTLEQCIHERMPRVMGVDAAGRVRPAAISDWIDSGVKPVFRVRTRLGREVEVTGHHPFLTVLGWQPLDRLRIGDRIAVPRAVPVFGSVAPPAGLVRLMAYYLAEGSLTGISPGFTNPDPAIVADFRAALAEHVPARSFRQDRLTRFAVIREYKQHRHLENPVTAWLRSVGLWGKKAEAKRFPTEVWTWTREALVEFVRALFSCDATIYAMSRQGRIELTVASPELASDAQHALTRLGIVSKRWQKTPRSWCVAITEPRSVERYQAEIGWIGEKASRSFELPGEGHADLDHPGAEIGLMIRELLDRRAISVVEMARPVGKTTAFGQFGGDEPPVRRGSPQGRQQRYAIFLGDERLERATSPDLYWDAIVAIEPLGDHQVFDLTVPDGANFIAEDVCVHNTSFALNLAQNVAKSNQLPVLVFSLEMSKEQLAQRLICAEARINAQRIKTGFLQESDWPKLTEAIGTLASAPIYIDDTPAITVMEVRGKARRLKALEGGKDLGLIVIDYLQLMSAGRAGDGNRVQEISAISRSLKALARELEVPIIALSQLSRAVESRTDKHPMLSDLRESGSIEQDADIVMFIYRDDYYNQESLEKNIAEIIVAKHRNGPVGKVKLFFENEFTRFENLAQGAYQNDPV